MDSPILLLYLYPVRPVVCSRLCLGLAWYELLDFPHRIGKLLVLCKNVPKGATHPWYCATGWLNTPPPPTGVIGSVRPLNKCPTKRCYPITIPMGWGTGRCSVGQEWHHPRLAMSINSRQDVLHVLTCPLEYYVWSIWQALPLIVLRLMMVYSITGPLLTRWSWHNLKLPSPR